MKIKSGLLFGLAVICSLAVVLALKTPLTLALGQTCTWTGNGDGTSFSNANNWSGCSNAAPTNASNLVFDTTGQSTFATLNNDLTSLSLANITIQGTGSSYGYSFYGNPISLSGGITDNSDSYTSFDLGMTFTANQTITVQNSFASLYFGNELLSNFNIGNHILNFQSGDIAAAVYLYDNLLGSGTINFSAPSGGYSAYLLENASAFTGRFNLVQGVGYFDTAGTFAPGGNNISDSSEAVLGSFNGETVSAPISVIGNGYGPGEYSLNGQTYVGGAINTIANTGKSGSVNFTNVTLTGNATVWADTSSTMSFTNLQANGYCLIPSVDSLGTISGGSSSCQQTQTATVQSGNNLPASPATVNSGQELFLDGSRGTTTVDQGGILKGNGTAASLAVDPGGTVAPGHSPGCMTISGDLHEGGTYQAEIGGSAACSSYDQLQVSGSVILNDGGSPSHQGGLQVSLVNGFQPQAGQTFEVIDNKGTNPISDTFDGLPEGATFNVSGFVFKISYVGGTGNDVVLSVLSVPSPPDTGFVGQAKRPLFISAGVVVFSLSAWLCCRSMPKKNAYFRI